MVKKQYAFGIDLGTTNSCIAVKTIDKPASVITLADGRKTLPSCVMYKDGKVVVGYEAYKQRYDVNHVVYSSKRDIGSDKVYMVYANGDDKPPVAVTPVDVASEILKKLRDDAELVYGKGVISEVTITVPAYFTPERRAATIEAATLAGLEVIALINEPTSAAIAYTEGKSDAEQILVYDLGGGTFDVTLLEMIKSSETVDSLFDDVGSSETMASVITSQGNPRLGGDDIDELTYNAAILDARESACKRYPELPEDINLSKYITLESKERLILAIEKNKKDFVELSAFTAPITVNFNSKEYVVPVTVSVDNYRGAFRKVYDESMKLVHKCLVGHDISKIAKIILIGGSTKLQELRDTMQNDFETPIYTALNPDEAVALGAATNTSIIYGDTNMAISDVLPQSVGIEYCADFGGEKINGRFKVLISKDTPLPTSATTKVQTIEPNQSEVRVPIYQGEDSLAENNSYVGVVKLSIAPQEDIQEVFVTLSITSSGVLQATVASAESKVSVELENVLRPSVSTRTSADKFIARYEVLLEKYATDAELYSEGKGLLTRFRDGVIEFSAVKGFFDSLTMKQRQNAKKSFDELSQFNSAINKTYLFSSDDSSDDDEDEG